MDDLLAIIGRVRRLMPRNAEVMAICDAAEKATVNRVQEVASEPKAVEVGRMGSPPKRDRAAYMRAYRAKKSTKKKVGET